MAIHNVSDVFPLSPVSDLSYLSRTFSCDDYVPPCNISKGFDFPIMWNITLRYFDRCNSSGKWLFPHSDGSENSASLSQLACETIAGRAYANYLGTDVWSCLTTWKFPLLQLIANSPKPPLGIGPQLFVALHLSGDPIGSIVDVIWNIECCQSRAIYWQNEFSTKFQPPTVSGESHNRERFARLWKAFTIITDSYDEWGSEMGDCARNALLRGLNSRPLPDGILSVLQPTLEQPEPQVRDQQDGDFFKICFTTAAALAADRSTRFGGILTAQLLFIAVFFIALVRTSSAASSENRGVYANIEIHSIAFSALYFWLIPATLLTSVIGASQTAEAIPRILTRFERDLTCAGLCLGLPVIDAGQANLQHKRLISGGVYTWQPGRADRWAVRVEAAKKEKTFLVKHKRKAGSITLLKIFSNRCLSRCWPVLGPLLPVLAVGFAMLSGTLMSCFVPPRGWQWRCRSGGQLLFLIGWVMSCTMPEVIKWIRDTDRAGAFVCMKKLVPIRITSWFRSIFTNSSLRYVLCKDSVATLLSIAWILETQFGIYNKCACYTRSGETGLALPEQPNVKQELLEGLKFRGNYTTILSAGLGAQALIILLLLWRYHSAYRVFMQADDGSSNVAWLRNVRDWTEEFRGLRSRRNVESEDAPSPGPFQSVIRHPQNDPLADPASPDEHELESLVNNCRASSSEIRGSTERSQSSFSLAPHLEERPSGCHRRDKKPWDVCNRIPSDGRLSDGNLVVDRDQHFNLPLNIPAAGCQP